MTNFLEHSYTSSRFKGGYYTIQYSRGLSEYDIRQLETNGLYNLPETDRYDPRPEESELARYPIQFNVYRLEDGRRVFGRSVYRGRDNHSRSARPGNYYSHSLVLADRQLADQVLACEVYESEIWDRRLEENKLGDQPRDEQLPPLSLQLQHDSAQYIWVIEQLLKGEMQEERLLMLATVMDLLLDGVYKSRRIVIIDEDQALPLWICTITLVLPPRLYEDIHFSSFYANPQQGDARVVCSVEDCKALFAESRDAEIIQRSPEKAAPPRHDFTQALCVLIDEIIDAEDTLEKEKKWRNFMGQIAKVRTLGVELDKEVKYYKEMIGWEQFSLEEFEAMLYKYPNKAAETKDKMLEKPHIRSGYFEKEIEEDRVIELGEVKKYTDDKEEINKYAFLIALRAKSLDRIESLYSWKDDLNSSTKRSIKKQGLNLVMKFGEMNNLDEARINRLDEISGEKNDKPEEIKLEIFRYLCKLKKSSNSDIINVLFAILEKAKGLNDVELDGLKRDLHDSLPRPLPEWLDSLPQKEKEIRLIFNLLDAVLAPPAGAPPQKHDAVNVLLNYLEGNFEEKYWNEQFCRFPPELQLKIINKINNKGYREKALKTILWPSLQRPFVNAFKDEDFISHLKTYDIELQKEFIQRFFERISSHSEIPIYAESLLMNDFFTRESSEEIISYLLSLIPTPRKSVRKKYPEHVTTAFSKEEAGTGRLNFFSRFWGLLKKKDQEENETDNLTTLLDEYSPDNDQPCWTWLYLEVLTFTAISKEDIIFSGLIRHFLNDKRYKDDNYDKKYCVFYLKSIKEFSNTQSFLNDHNLEIEAIFDEKKWLKIHPGYNKTEKKRKSEKKAKPESPDTQNTIF